jgi:dTDP-4-amino-4,6-dideoxygalactose transaminase
MPAAILRPQLGLLDSNCKRWNERYHILERILSASTEVTLTHRPVAEQYVGSSIQFFLNDMSSTQIESVITECRAHGVELKWFGAEKPTGYTSRHNSWRYIEQQDLSKTDQILSKLLDMRIPLTFSVEDCQLIGEIITEAVAIASKTKVE